MGICKWLNIYKVNVHDYCLMDNHYHRYAKEKSLKEHFKDCKTRDERNRAILNAIEDDYKQVEVAKYLGISDSAVSKVFLAMSRKSGDS